jgi:mycothiol S-conjugate amidase
MLQGGLLLGALTLVVAPPAKAVPRETTQRLLVIAPHPDDESLGGAAMIQRTLQHGGQVRIVVMTNGDGFRHAARKAFHVSVPHGNELYRFGLLRQKEELAAAARLGVPPENVTFLGYPDAGLHRLWETHWEPTHPYMALNGHRAVPYERSLHKGAPYCGASVAEDLRRVVDQFHPTDVLYPDPRDVHRDHWATSAFAQHVLAGMAERPHEWLYLVHYPNFPEPRSYRPHKGLAPPEELAGKGQERWLARTLTAAQRAQKQAAILEHRSQIRVMKDLLLSFVRTNDLLTIGRTPTLHTLPDGQEPFFTPGPLPYKVVKDVANDQTFPNNGHGVVQDPAADIGSVAAVRGSGRLQLCVEFGGALRLDRRYFIRLRNPQATCGVPVHLDAVIEDGELHLKPQLADAAEPHPTVYFWRNHLILSLPLSALGDSHALLVSAEVKQEDFTVDKTPWRTVRW